MHGPGAWESRIARVATCYMSITHKRQQCAMHIQKFRARQLFLYPPPIQKIALLFLDPIQPRKEQKKEKKKGSRGRVFAVINALAIFPCESCVAGFIYFRFSTPFSYQDRGSPTSQTKHPHEIHSSILVLVYTIHHKYSTVVSPRR